MVNLPVALQDLDSETLAHIDAESRRQTLEEELEFLKSVHEQVTIKQVEHCRVKSMHNSAAAGQSIKGLILYKLGVDFYSGHRRRLVLNMGENQNLGKGVNPGGVASPGFLGGERRSCGSRSGS